MRWNRTSLYIAGGYTKDRRVPSAFFQELVAVWFVSRYFGRDYSGNFTNESWRILKKKYLFLGNGRYRFYVPIEKQVFCRIISKNGKWI